MSGDVEKKTEMLDVLFVGAGFSGLYMLYKLRELGFRTRVIEAGSGVGGTWYWNRYPGARCDVPSIEYSYSFSPELEAEWRWTERYATQPEILKYLEHVAERFDLNRDITFNTRVTAAKWNKDTKSWTVHLDSGEEVEARYFILGTGCLSDPKLPDWPGIEKFTGEIAHTAHWRDDIDLKGKRVAVVGTGSSGIQIIPQIAEVAESLTVFQRTPSFAVPANNYPLTDEIMEEIKPRLPELRESARHNPLGWFDAPRDGSAKAAPAEERSQRFEEHWNAGTTGLLLAYGDLLLDEDSNRLCADFAREKIAKLVKDPERACHLTPTDYPIGSRRLCSEIGYYDAMNRDNVELVDVRDEPIREVTEDALVTAKGRYPIDVLVLATGFNAMTGAINKIDIRGPGNHLLREEWADGPRSYLGLAVAGFPNLFTITGPGSPSVFSNVVVSIEQHVEWIADCLSHLRESGKTTIEATEGAESAWMAHSDEVANMTVFPKSDSWYKGRTRDGKLVFMPYVGGVGAYRGKCNEIARAGYEGFVTG
ncbi:NAD(P)/FAD-dependent oxidoreductase [Emcibacter sp.]|uniref:flavin-containing monooxygenase n=1 Tax=Emcibacter sp. TaxID=1979954 RepID=UPI002AA873B4|nr:NAD(P)/FAD-dependent oxidoreductase [Emcibacter sp.]